MTVRLACVRHAASVHPEPGSNSPFEKAPCGASFQCEMNPGPYRLYQRNRPRRAFALGVRSRKIRKKSGSRPQSSCGLVCSSVSGFQGARPLARGCRVKRREFIVPAVFRDVKKNFQISSWPLGFAPRVPGDKFGIMPSPAAWGKGVFSRTHFLHILRPRSILMRFRTTLAVVPPSHTTSAQHAGDTQAMPRGFAFLPLARLSLQKTRRNVRSFLFIYKGCVPVERTLCTFYRRESHALLPPTPRGFSPYRFWAL